MGQEDHLEKEMATHSNILAWRIPCTEEPGRLQSMGSQRVGANTHTHTSFDVVTKFKYIAIHIILRTVPSTQ